MAEGRRTEGDVAPTERQRRAQRARSIAIALALAAFVLVVYLASVLKFGANVLNRPL